MKGNFKTHYLRMIALSDLLIQGQKEILYFQSNKDPSQGQDARNKIYNCIKRKSNSV